MTDLSIGDRAVVSPDYFEKRWAGRAGVIRRRNRCDGWYVELDPKPRERVKKVELILDGGLMPEGRHE